VASRDRRGEGLVPAPSGATASCDVDLAQFGVVSTRTLSCQSSLSRCSSLLKAEVRRGEEARQDRFQVAWVVDSEQCGPFAGGLRQSLRGHQSFTEASLLSHLAVTRRTHVQRLSPKNKGGFPYTPCRAGYRNGGEGTACPIHGHMLFHWLC
jgi:hypothetical protein